MFCFVFCFFVFLKKLGMMLQLSNASVSFPISFVGLQYKCEVKYMRI